MPFITEEIWQNIKPRTEKDALIIASYPGVSEYDETAISAFEHVKNIISNIRKIRKEKNIPNKEKLELYVVENQQINKDLLPVLQKTANLSDIRFENFDGDAVSFRVDKNEYFVPMKGLVDEAEEKEKLTEELKYLEGFLQSVRKKLNNERFVQNAPAQVVEKERKKEADALEKIAIIKKRLERL
jgi:valyl-tRNA synthetase